MTKSVLKTVKARILNQKNQNKIWSYSDFSDLPFGAATKALSLLTKDGQINRIQKGYYYIPKQTILGEVKRDYTDLLFKKLDNKNIFYCLSGLSGYNKIGLTTQISNIITIACDTPMRSTDKVKFLLRKKPHSGTEIERIVLDALNDIENISGTTPDKVLYKIKNIIKSNKISINDLGHSALSEVRRVRAIIGAVGQELDMDAKLLKQLKNKVNPATVYLLDISSVLKYSSNWNIKARNDGKKILKRA